MVMCYTFRISPLQLNNISHQTTFPAQNTIPHQSHHFSHIPPDHIASHGVMWNVFAMPDVGCCALFILMWLRCGIYAIWCDAKCDVVQCQMRCGDAIWCDAKCDVVQCQMRCGDAMWCDAKCDVVQCQMRCGVMLNVTLCNVRCDVV